MIIVFGSISMDMYLSVDDLNDNRNFTPAVYHDMVPGGKGAAQALAAARSEAKVALVGKVGDDDFSTTILNRLRREGVMTSGVAKSDQPTGINVIVSDKTGKIRDFHAAGANYEASEDQVPEEILGNKAFLLLQTEVRAEVNTALLAKAKACGATTMMNLAPAIDLSQKALNNLDYLILNKPEAEILAQKIGMKEGGDLLKLAQGLSKQGNLNCIITVGAAGGVACTKDGVSWSVGTLKIDEIVDKSGAEDSYCGTLAACLQANMPLPRAMKRASIAASLTCLKKGRLAAIPYLGDIDERINDLDDPVQVKT